MISNDAVSPANIVQGTSAQVLMTNATPDTAWTSISGALILGPTGVTNIGEITAAATTPRIAGAAASNRILWWYTSTTPRWALYTDSGAESGSNAGSDFRLARYSDGGGSLGIVMTATRSSGLITVTDLNVTTGFQRNGTTARALVDTQSVAATATASPTSTTFIACPGATVTLSLVNGDRVVVNAVWDMQCDTDGTVGVGGLFVAGVAQSALAVLANPTNTAAGGDNNPGVRATIAQNYVINNTTTGSVTYDLRVRCGAGFTSGVQARLDHTKITVQVYR
jgi:hypothetical protein